nr:NAD-dependent epimerase/dehydratase family protein [uncultured Albidiferax sp.]
MTATTVLGGRGFIGRHVVARLQAQGHACWVPERDDPSLFTRPLGQVIYCIGITANFRTQPFATVDANLGVLRQVLERATFDQLLYLSSTRVYDGADSTDEGAPLRVQPGWPDHLYNLSKLMGESLALSSGRPCRVARVCNVIGPGMGPTNFVGALLHAAHSNGAVQFQTALASVKDYVWIDDAVEALLAIAQRGVEPIYNIATGQPMRHAALAQMLAHHGVAVSVAADAPVVQFPPVAVQRLQRDTGTLPRPVAPLLSAWLASYLSNPKEHA